MVGYSDTPNDFFHQFTQRRSTPHRHWAMGQGPRVQTPPVNSQVVERRKTKQERSCRARWGEESAVFEIMITHFCGSSVLRKRLPVGKRIISASEKSGIENQYRRLQALCFHLVLEMEVPSQQHDVSTASIDGHRTGQRTFRSRQRVI